MPLLSLLIFDSSEERDVPPADPNEPDPELMRRAQADDADAFGHLFDRHAAYALRVAMSILHRADRAEEAVQEGFLSMWRARSSYRATENGSFRAWAMQTVRNRAIDSLRRDAALKRPSVAGEADVEDVVDAAHGSPLEQIIFRSESDALRISMLGLPEKQAEVIDLAYFGGLTHAQIAEHLDLPEGTVKGRMRLGMEKLRGSMDEPE